MESNNLNNELIVTSDKMEEQCPPLHFEPIYEIGKKVSETGMKNSNVVIKVFAVSGDYFGYGTMTGEYGIFSIKTGKPIIPPTTLPGNRITGLSFDETSKFCVISNQQGIILCFEIGGNSSYQKKYTHNTSILESTIDPSMVQNENSEFSCVFGDDKGSIYRIRPKKSIFSTNFVPKEIYHAESSIREISWKGDLICWVNESHCVVYHAKQESILYEFKINASKFHPSILIESDHIIHLICNFSHFTINLQTKSHNGDNNTNKIQIIMSGKDKSYLYYDATQNTFSVGVTRYGEFLRQQCPIIVTDSPNMFNIYLASCKDMYFLACYKTIYSISFTTLKERISFELHKDRLDKSMEILSQSASSLTDLFDICSEIFQYMVEHDLKKEALLFLFEYFQPKDSHFIWKKCSDSNILDQYGQYISSDIHIYKEYLTPSQLESIIIAFLNKDLHQLVFLFVDNAPLDKINIPLLVDIIHRKNDQTYQKILMILYLHHQNYHTEGYDLALRLQDPILFEFIKKHNRINYVLERLMEFSLSYGKDFVKILINDAEDYKPTILMEQINSEITKILNLPSQDSNSQKITVLEQLQLHYLHKLFKKNVDKEFAHSYAAILVKLYLKMNHPNTLTFLNTSNDYDFSIAREAALEFKRKKEAAFLCRRTGDIVKGMEMLLTTDNANPTDNDVKDALDYANSVDDKIVWRILTTFSYKNSKYLHAIIRNLPSLHINPVKYIQGIPPSISFNEYNQDVEESIKGIKRKVTTAELTYDIVSKDAFNAFSKHLSHIKNGKIKEFPK